MQPIQLKILNHPKCEVFPYVPKLHWIEKHAKSISEKLKSNTLKEANCAKIWAIVLPILLSLSILLIPLAIKFSASLKRFNSLEQFYASIQTKTPPRIEDILKFQTKTQTFNHLSDFVIHEDVLWTRSRITEKGNWKPIYFDGSEKGLVPKKMHTDGANLVVIDQINEVHYKKVIHDKYDLKNKIYRCSDKATKDNWKKEWFSLPFVHPFVNLFTGKKLNLPPFTEDFSMSQRGQFNSYLEDAIGTCHTVAEGVTTLYILDQSGQNIYMFDPWKPKHVLVKIAIPGTSDSSFVAKKISASASQILLIGYEYKKNIEGKTIKVPAIKTLFADIDSLGWNPILQYSYFPEDQKSNKNVRILPTVPNGWITHPLPEGEITDSITLLQTGQGNNEREIRVLGKNTKGENGYWSKMVADHNWKFNPLEDKEVPMETTIMKESQIEPEEFIKPVVKNWVSSDKDYDLSLNDFNHESLLGKLVVNKKTTLLLHKKENIIKKILTGGKKSDYYDLVLLDPTQKKELPASIKNFFGQSKVVTVNVVENGENLIIQKKAFFSSELKIVMHA